MKIKSDDEIKSLLLNLFWDAKVDPDELLGLFTGKIERIGSIDRSSLYYRILTSFDWHTILKIVPLSNLKALLDDDIINRIHPKDLKDKYLYARSVLSE
jgi:hypothetical protein